MKRHFKNALVVALCFAVVSPVRAGSDEEEALKAFSEVALETIATEFLKDQLNQFVVTNVVGTTALDAYLAEQFGEKAGTGIVNQLFAGYNLYKSAEAFDKSKTQSQKYYSTIGMIGSAISFVQPQVGSIILLANLASQLTSSVINKHRVERLIELQKEIVEIYTRVVDVRKREAVADLQILSFYFGGYFQYLRKSILIERLMKDSCEFIPPDDVETTFKCFDYAIKKHDYLKLAISHLELSLKFANQYFDIDKVLEANKSALRKTDLLQSIDALKVQFVAIDGALERLHLQFASRLYEMSKNEASTEVEKLKIKNQCLLDTSKYLSYINRTEQKLILPEMTRDQVEMLVSYRAEQLTGLKYSARQCLLIEDLTAEQRSSLEAKIGLAMKLEAKDLSFFYTKHQVGRTF